MAEFETCAAKNITTKTCDTSAKEVSHVLVFFFGQLYNGCWYYAIVYAR